MSRSAWCELAVSADQFKGLVEFSGFSYRGAAEEASRVLRKDRKRPQIQVSHTVIANLANGKSKTIHPRRARAIEEILKVPAGHVFLMRLSPVSRDGGTSERMSA